MSAVGVIFSNIHDDNVPELSHKRTMGSLPYGGRYRLIDFALSNLVNSGVTTVGIITKNNYQSLMDHLGSGKDWDLARKTGGLVLLPPFGAMDNAGLYRSRLEALKGITGFLSRRNEDYVILCDCDGVYHMDFTKVIEYHEAKQADITLVCHNEEIGNSSRYTLVQSDETGRVVDIKNDTVGGSNKFFSNILVINRAFLLRLINDATAHGYQSFEEDILRRNIVSLKIYSYDFHGYHATIDSLRAYFAHNMELLQKPIRDELFGDHRDLHEGARFGAFQVRRLRRRAQFARFRRLHRRRDGGKQHPLPRRKSRQGNGHPQLDRDAGYGHRRKRAHELCHHG